MEELSLNVQYGYGVRAMCTRTKHYSCRYGAFPPPEGFGVHGEESQEEILIAMET